MDHSVVLPKMVFGQDHLLCTFMYTLQHAVLYRSKFIRKTETLVLFSLFNHDWETTIGHFHEKKICLITTWFSLAANVM